MSNDTAMSKCEKMAVRISNGVKIFRGKTGSGQTLNDVSVLNNFNLNVPAGSLYSLLGSNGCGKTTVISIIIGQCKLDRGKIEVLTSSRAFGYMPQETCLYSEFSIFETLQYFAILFGIRNDSKNTNNHLKSRIRYLIKLFLLPSEKQIVGTLSGGQKRRLSLAVALVNEPNILLLDEPTSGVDPLLRELIWEHLTKLANTKGTTILLTTHYVDEAKGSNIVGFMRNGKLIAEDTPSNLFEKHNTNSLETIFLAICEQQTFQNLSLANHSSDSSSLCPISQRNTGDVRRQGIDMNITLRRIYALVGKNYKCMFRNLWTFLFITTIPAIWMLVTCIAYRNDPYNIAMGLVNHDIREGPVDNNMGCITNETIKQYCRMEQLSCIFLENLTGNTLKFVSFESIKSATLAVEEGSIWGYISFSKNYTSALTNRILMGSSSYFDETQSGSLEWNNSKIIVRLDQTNTLIYTKITTTLYEALENSAKIMMKTCGYDERIAEYPLQYMKPIVGEKTMASLKYVGPSLAIEYEYDKYFYCFINE